MAKKLRGLNFFLNIIRIDIKTKNLVTSIEKLSLSGDINSPLIKVYDALIKAGVMYKKEGRSVRAWVKEIEKYL